jgi:hypothetical protein
LQGEAWQTIPRFTRSKSSRNGSFVFQDIGSDTFHGIPCLTGVDNRPGNWMSGRRVFVPIKRVVGIVEFDSLEEYTRAVKQWRADKDKGDDVAK